MDSRQKARQADADVSIAARKLMAHNAKVSGAGTASAGLPGYAAEADK